jgi:hypothetical protein
MPSVTMSFERRRKVLLGEMSKQASGPTVEKVIRFQNNDVPRFLATLDKFEAQSRKARLVVK